jgi:outer membrane protein insertion porin family
MRWCAALVCLLAGLSPCLAEPAFDFQGAQGFTGRELVGALRSYRIPVEAPVDVTDADDAAFFLREFYLDRGYAGVAVDYRFDPRSGTAVLEVDEGTVSWLGSVSFEGNTVFPAERLRGMVMASLRRSSRSLFGRLRHVEEALETAAGVVRSEYLAAGHLGAEVEFSSVPGFRRDTVDTVFRIDEGPLFKIRRVETTGGDRGKVAGILDSLAGSVWTPGRDALLRDRLVDALQDGGHRRAAAFVDVEIDFDAGEVDLGIILDPGEVYRLGNLKVIGLDRTSEAAVRRKFDFPDGEVFDEGELDESERRLWFTGAFSDVDLVLHERPGNILDGELSLVEGKARQLRGALGYSQWEQGFIDLVYTDRNFLGSLLSLGLQGHWSFRSHGGVLRLVEPMVLNTQIRGSLGVFYARQELPAYEATFLGGALRLERIYTEGNLTGHHLEYSWTRVSDIDIFGVEGSDLEQPYTVGKVTFGQALDRRNDPLAPNSGFLLDYEAGLASRAFGSGVEFLHLEASAAWFVPLTKPTPQRQFVPFLHFRHAAGWILPYGDDAFLPAPERFYMGGQESVRSFLFDGMGPRDEGGNPTGGQLFWFLSGELQYPVFGPLHVVGFLDVGNLAASPADYDPGATAFAPGAGLRLYTPIGAILLDYGYNLVRNDGDPVGAWSFGFGFSF